MMKSYYSVYLLNRTLKQADSNNNNTNANTNKTSVAQFLDKEATVNKDFSLSLILNNLPNANETLVGENLSKRIEKATVYASNTGYIAVFNLNFKKDDAVNDSIIYYYLHRQPNEPKNEYIICLILEDANNNLDLFRNELDFYFEKYLMKHFNQMELNSNDNLIDLLSNWYEYSIEFISRSFKVLKNGNFLSIFMDQSLTCGNLELTSLDERLDRDLNILFKSINSSYLLLANSSDSLNQSKKISLNSSNESSKLTIRFDDDTKSLILSKKEASRFSKECANTLLELDLKESGVFKAKQELENFKLKLAQEFNTFNRYLRKAPNNYYDLYKLYLYLKSSPISQTLIHLHKNNNHELTGDLLKVLDIVVEFYNKQNFSL